MGTIELLLTLLLIVPVLVLMTLTLFEIDSFEWVFDKIDMLKSKRKLKKAEGAKELKKLVGITAYKWMMKNLIDLDNNKRFLYQEDLLKEESNCSLYSDKNYDFISLKFFYVLNEFVKDPDEFNFLLDYQEILQSIYSSHKIFVEDKLISSETFWLERVDVVNEMCKDFLLIKDKREHLMSVKRKNEVIALRKKNEEDMLSIKNLKEYRKKYYG